MVYLPLTPTTYPHTLTYYILINMDVSLKGSTLSQVRETLLPAIWQKPRGRATCQTSKRQTRLWCSCSTRLSPSAHACSRRLLMAGLSLSCIYSILMWRMCLPLPKSSPSGSFRKLPKKKPKLMCFSKTVTYKIRSKPESLGPYPNAS
jgi:hypothetical protein